jgi:phosphoribosylaminoimidazole-succinocarboxamide synthase
MCSSSSLVVISAHEQLGETGTSLAHTLAKELTRLGFLVVTEQSANSALGAQAIMLVPSVGLGGIRTIPVGPSMQLNTLLELVLRRIPFDFNSLPLYVEGESKEIRRWTEKVVLVKMKPTVYSYTHNRCGLIPGTDKLRLSFTCEIFRRMHSVIVGETAIKTSFLGEIGDDEYSYIAEHLVETCNLEIRVKRYHIGSPVRRYLYTETYPSVDSCPITRWTYFKDPVVCFDWRHPLKDHNDNRLADEPLSDDYAGLWMFNVPGAKRLAKSAFLWLESEFARVGMRIIDGCFFIDRYGSIIYGEVSPDCMRIRRDMQNPATADAADKDLWRQGKSPEEVLAGYAEVNRRLNIPSPLCLV